MITTQERNAFARMLEKISQMTNHELKTTWDNLRHYDPSEYYDTGIKMDEWAQYVYSELSKRTLPTI